jgi:MFS family permease
MDRWGRKAGVIYCSIFSLIGGALLCGAQNVGMFIAARFIAGWGSWGFLAVSTYTSMNTRQTWNHSNIDQHPHIPPNLHHLVFVVSSLA